MVRLAFLYEQLREALDDERPAILRAIQSAYVDLISALEYTEVTCHTGDPDAIRAASSH